MRVDIGYIKGGKYYPPAISIASDLSFCRLSREHQACVRLCMEALRRGDAVDEISPHLIVEGE